MKTFTSMLHILESVCKRLPLLKGSVMRKFQFMSVPQNKHIGAVAIMHLQLEGRAVLPDERFPLCLY